MHALRGWSDCMYVSNGEWYSGYEAMLNACVCISLRDAAPLQNELFVPRSFRCKVASHTRSNMQRTSHAAALQCRQTDRGAPVFLSHCYFNTRERAYSVPAQQTLYTIGAMRHSMCMLRETLTTSNCKKSAQKKKKKSSSMKMFLI